MHGTSELVFNVEKLPERDSRGSSRLHAGEQISVYDRFTVHNFRQNWRNGAQAWCGSRASVRPRLQRQMCRHPARQHTQSLRHEGKIFKIWSVRTLRDTSALIPLDSRPGSIQLTCLIAIVSSNSATCIQSNVSLIPPDERPTGLRPVLEQNTETNQGLAARLVGELPAQWPRQLQYREFLIRMLWSGSAFRPAAHPPDPDTRSGLLSPSRRSRNVFFLDSKIWSVDGVFPSSGGGSGAMSLHIDTCERMLQHHTMVEFELVSRLKLQRHWWAPFPSLASLTNRPRLTACHESAVRPLCMYDIFSRMDPFV